MSAPMIELLTVSKTFHNRRGAVNALKEASFTVRKGDVFGLLGPNGAGKTTAMRCILGLTRISNGTLRVLGEERIDRRALFARAAYLPEEPQLFTGATGREHLAYFARLNGLPKNKIDGRIEQVLMTAGLTDAADRQIHTYSKGMKQRLGIAAAVLPEPEIIFLDEPTRGLDPIGNREVRDLLERLAEQGATMFLNSHMLGEVERLCNRVVILADGKVRAEGELSELLKGGESIVVRFSLPENVAPNFPAQREVNGLYKASAVDTAELAQLVARIAAVEGRVIKAESERVDLEDFFVRIVREGEGA